MTITQNKVVKYFAPTNGSHFLFIMTKIKEKFNFLFNIFQFI